MYLPWVKGSNSKAELCPITEKTPRLFKSYKGAAQAMRSWARGIHTAKGSWESDGDGYSWNSDSYYVVDEIVVSPQKHRRLEDVCVVELDIIVREIA